MRHELEILDEIKLLSDDGRSSPGATGGTSAIEVIEWSISPMSIRRPFASASLTSTMLPTTNLRF